MPADTSASRPNILLITTDTQRMDTLSCMGHDFAVSPNIDRMASEGVCFEQGHTSSPLCGPARCSLLTGTHTPIHGRIENGLGIDSDRPNVFDSLKNEGYRNIMVGKTHFGMPPNSVDTFHFAIEKGLDHDDDYARHINKHGYHWVSDHPNDIPPDLFIDSWIAETTIDEIDFALEADRDPFFAFCSMISPHPPLDPPGEYQDLIGSFDLPEVTYDPGELRDLPAQIKTLLGMDEEKIERLEAKYGSEAGRKAIENYRQRYYALSAYVDAQIGKLLDYLDEKGIREETLVIFTSDHGTTLYDHGFSNKHNYYDCTWRVPMVLSQPGTLPQDEYRDFAIWNDLTTTILGAAGTSCPDMQGFDLYEPLREGNASPRQCAVGTMHRSMALATDRWKLEFYLDGDGGRLFDRDADPNEQHDRYGDHAYAEVQNTLERALLEWRSEIMDVTKLRRLLPEQGGNGGVAGRAVDDLHTVTGLDAERRLNERVAGVNSIDIS